MGFIFRGPHSPEEVDSVQALCKSVKGMDEGNHFRASQKVPVRMWTATNTNQPGNLNTSVGGNSLQCLFIELKEDFHRSCNPSSLDLAP